MLSLPSTAERLTRDVYTIVSIGGVTLGIIILSVAAWSILSAWQEGGVQDKGEAVSGFGTPGEKCEK
jgi:hypothetical protein